jgi:CheY-like chemotaxis protein
MPGGDGYDFIRRVRQTWGYELPAVAITAHASAEDRIRSLAAGFQIHLSKPIEPNELIVCVASLTARLNENRG